MPLTIAKIKQIRQINSPNGEFFLREKDKVESQKNEFNSF